MEQVALPDAAIAADYLLRLTRRLVDGLVVDADQMQANLESTGGLVFTSAVLLDLVRSGLSPGGRVRAGPGRGDGDLGGRPPFREALRAHADKAGVSLDEAGLDEAISGAVRGPPRLTSTASSRCPDRWAGSDRLPR